ncbi:unnamed protein product [Arctia plantaginis]|uniref:Uncharacterized protein n=1 Tax=Arctia plantaginis TaxID=874455 RepID=A0A8S1AT43_ARCPL|nr:unnamed protein product [Arctia plantaginis]CAB3248021.1 unnamed protein product [Arctia plantaginis]
MKIYKLNTNRNDSSCHAFIHCILCEELDDPPVVRRSRLHVTVILTVRRYSWTKDDTPMTPRKADSHSVCTRNPMISVIIWYKPRDYERQAPAVTH